MQKIKSKQNLFFPVLKLGSRGPGGDARSLRLCSQAFASVRNRSQSSAIVRNRSQSFASVRGVSDLCRTCVGHENRRETQNCRHVYVSHHKSVNSHKDRGVVVAKPRTVVTFGLVLRLRVSKVSTVTGIGGVVLAKPRTVVTFGLVSGLRVSKMSTVTGIRGVVVAKPRTVVTFRLVSGLRVSEMSTFPGSGGSWSRNPKLSSVLDPSRVFAFQKCQQSQGWGGRGRETQNCRHFWTRPGSSHLKSVNSHKDQGGRWTRLASSRLKSVNRHRDRGGRGRETQNCRHFWTRPGLRVSNGGRETQNCRHFSTRVGSSRFRNVNIPRIGGVVVAKPRTVVSFGPVSRLFAFQKCQQSQGWGGSCRETQNCRHFWTRPGSSHLKSVNSHKVQGGRWTSLAFQKCQPSQRSGGSWSRNPELSSLLDSPLCEERTGVVISSSYVTPLQLLPLPLFFEVEHAQPPLSPSLNSLKLPYERGR